jgi:HUS1 checkpoint protein
MLPWPSDVLRAVSERYRSLSDKFLIMANMEGELKLRVETDEVKVETRWTGLINPPLGTSNLKSKEIITNHLLTDPEAVNLAGHPSTSRPPNEFSQIKIDAKDWSNLLRVSVVARSMLACSSHTLHR